MARGSRFIDRAKRAPACNSVHGCMCMYSLSREAGGGEGWSGMGLFFVDWVGGFWSLRRNLFCNAWTGGHILAGCAVD